MRWTSAAVTRCALDNEDTELLEDTEADEYCLYIPTPPTLPVPVPTLMYEADPDPVPDPVAAAEETSTMPCRRCCGDSVSSNNRGTLAGLCPVPFPFPCPCPLPFILRFTFESSSETLRNRPDSCSAGTGEEDAKAF